MVNIKTKCGTCGKFEVPAEHRHLVKPEQAGRVCRCAPAAQVAPVVVERLVVRETFWVKAIALGMLLTGIGWGASWLYQEYRAEKEKIRLAIEEVDRRIRSDANELMRYGGYTDMDAAMKDARKLYQYRVQKARKEQEGQQAN
jgi:hypothetical protein